MRRLQIQRHHLSYEPEVIVKITKGEHLVATWLGRMKKPTVAFMNIVENWLAEHIMKGKEGYYSIEQVEAMYAENQRKRQKRRRKR